MFFFPPSSLAVFFGTPAPERLCAEMPTEQARVHPLVQMLIDLTAGAAGEPEGWRAAGRMGQEASL